jgi:undecaprenyl-diphosphatase
MFVDKPAAMVPMRAGRWSAPPLTARWITLLPVLAAAVVLSMLAAGPGILPGDVAAARLVQSVPATGTADIARVVNAIGTTAGILIVGTVLIAVLAARNQVWPALFILAAILVRDTNFVLKALLDSPRPTAELVRVTEHNAFWGFPSGHTMGAVLLYGAILWIAPDIAPRRGRRVALQVIAWSMILGTGFARVYVGAHWPSDVVGAYLWGGFLFGLLILGHRHAQGLDCSRFPPWLLVESVVRGNRPGTIGPDRERRGWG